MWIDNVNLAGTYVGIEEQDNVQVSIRPNPSQGDFFIQTSQNVNAFRVTDITGKLIASEPQSDISNFSIDLKNEPSGVYFITLEFENHLQTLKLIKQ